MTFWWMQPGWADASCGVCGVNIKSTGGDPDWGRCVPCMEEHVSGQEQAAERLPPCSVCGEREAVTGVNGYGVCSEECAHAASDLEPTP